MEKLPEHYWLKRDFPNPTLDPSVPEVLELIKELGERLKITIVMVLHDMNFTARYSNRIYMLKDGHVYDYGRPDEIIAHDKMENVFGIDSQIICDEKNGCPFMIPEKLRVREHS